MEIKKGQTPIHLATDLSIIKELVQHGADVNSTDNDGLTPLHLACQSNIMDTVEFLLMNGANINAKNEEGDSVLDIAARSRLTDVVDLIIKISRLDYIEAGKPDQNQMNRLEKLRNVEKDPLLNDIIRKVAFKHISGDFWKTLASHWGFNQDHINAIEYRFLTADPPNHKEYSFRLIKIWAECLDPEEDPLIELQEAFRSVNQKSVADYIKKKLKKARKGPSERSCSDDCSLM